MKSTKAWALACALLGCSGNTADEVDNSGPGPAATPPPNERDAATEDTLGAESEEEPVSTSEPEPAPTSELEQAPDNVELAELPTAYAAAYCDWAFRCCSVQEQEHWQDAAFDFIGGSAEECGTNMQALLTLLVTQITSSESADRLVYDGVQFAACLQTIRTDCPYDLSEVCGPPFSPLVSLGGACQQNNECIDSVCIGASDETDGACAAARALGEPCDSDSECVSNHCDGAVCASPAAIGAACNKDDACSSGYCDYENSLCAEAPFERTCDALD